MPVHSLETRSLFGREQGRDLAVGFLDLGVEVLVKALPLSQDFFSTPLQNDSDLLFLLVGEVEGSIEAPHQLTSDELRSTGREDTAVGHQVDAVGDDTGDKSSGHA